MTNNVTSNGNIVPATGIGTASIVLGFLGLIPLAGVVPAALGLIFGLVGSGRAEHPLTRRRARVGLWLSVAALAWFPVVVFVPLAMHAAHGG